MRNFSTLPAWWIASAFLFLFPVCALAVEPQHPSQENFLSRAVFADGRLWILSDAGELSSLKPSEKLRQRVELGEPVLDLCTRDGHPEVVTCEREGCKTWTVRRLLDGKWTTARTAAVEKDVLVALVCSDQGEMLLTTDRLIDLQAAKPQVVALSDSLHKGLITSVLATKEHLFVGINRGEWGGGLQRIVRKTGKVERIEKNSSGQLCGGPLNPACDPVNGIAAEPGKPDCVVAAIGLMHFSPHGRIVEVCKDRVRRIYFKPYDLQGMPRTKRSARATKDDEPFSTVAFFGLAEVRGKLWAVGIDGIHQLEADGKATVIPLPKFETIDKIAVSFDLPEVALVLTSINRRMSISGAAPMLVPR